MSDIDVSAQPAAEPTPSAPATAPATPSAPPAAATSAAPTQTPATGAPPQEGWVPSYRLREAREAATRQANEQFAQREAAIRAEADRYRQQLHSLVGATPQGNPEVEAVRQQFASLYPGLAKMESQAAQLESLLERAGDLESQNSHYWTSYGRQTMDRLFNHASESIGTPLNEEAKRFLHSSFVGWVQSSPELTERYSTDPTIVEDYWKAVSSSLIDPSRRQASATVAGRAPQGLPQDSPSGAPMIPGAPKPKDLDERGAMAWAAFNAAKNQ